MSRKDEPIKDFKALSKAMGHETSEPRQTAALPNKAAMPRSSSPAVRPASKEPEFFAKDADYVNIAEQRMRALLIPNNANVFGNLTTSKIRNILTLVSQIYNEVTIDRNDALSADIQDRVIYMKVRMAYEAGRERKVKEFIEKTELLEAINHIGSSREKFLRYAKYLEALVAYHCFLGGKDN